MPSGQTSPAIRAAGRHASRRSRHHRAFTFVEMLATVLVLSFLVGATGTFYMVYQRVSLYTRHNSQAQTDLRTAFRSMERTLRHAKQVQAAGTLGSLVGNISNNYTQVIVLVPQSTGSVLGPGTTIINGIPYIEVEYYVLNGALWYRPSTSNTSTKVIDGVVPNNVGLPNSYAPSPTGLSIGYYQTAVSTSIAGPATVLTQQIVAGPSYHNATELRITLRVRSGLASTTTDGSDVVVSSYITMRNNPWLMNAGL